MPLQPQALLNGDHPRKIQLFIEALRSYGRASLRVSGTSMWPELWPGDTVEIRIAAMSEMKVGDLAAFTREERVFVHRVVASRRIDGALVLITRGDALDSDDPPVHESELLGVASLTEKVPRTFLRRIRQTLHYRLLPPVREKIRT